MLMIACLKPPCSAGASLDLLDRPALVVAARRRYISTQVAGPDSGLVAADAGPDLDDDRAHGLVVGRDEALLDGLDEPAGPRAQIGQLLAGERRRAPRPVSSMHRLQLRDLLERPAVVAVVGHDRLERRPLDRHGPHPPVVGERPRGRA